MSQLASRGGRVGSARPSDSGMVLLETALAIPLLVAVALALLVLGRLIVTEILVTGASRDAALLAARGMPPAEVANAVQDRLPTAQIAVEPMAEDLLSVTVSMPAGWLPRWGTLGITHEADTVAAREPGVSDDR